MPPIVGLNGASSVNGMSGRESVKVFSVEVPSLKPSRTQIADAVFRHFGFTHGDMPFLKERHNGTDPIAYFAQTLEYNPRSTHTAADGRMMTRVSLNAKDYEAMQKLAQAHHPQPSETQSQEATSRTTTREAVQSKQVYDQSAVIKAQVQRQVETQTANKDAEGVGAFFEGAFYGNFTDNGTWSSIAGQTAIGFVPVVGQVADARDIAAAAKDVVDGEDGSWAGLGIAAVAIIPGLDFLKGGSKVGRKVLAEVAEEGLSSVSQASLKQLGKTMSKEGIEQASKELVTLNVARAEITARLDDLLANGNLQQNAQSVVESARNSLRDHLTQDDLVGALRDMHNKPIRRSGDGYIYDHLDEVERGLASLNRAKGHLIEDMHGYQPGSEQFNRLSQDIEAVSETARRIEEFLQIK